MTTHSTTSVNAAPSITLGHWISNGVSHIYTGIIGHQQARANRSVGRYLARQSDARLTDLGYSADRIVALRRSVVTHR